jgi:hypothetical protein
MSLLSQESDADLPVCSPYSVCSKVDTYGKPFLEKQCRCPGSACSQSTHIRDGHTVHDRTKQFKVGAGRCFTAAVMVFDEWASRAF